MNIYIANIPFKANEDEVRELFARFGQVASVRIVLDKETQKSRGFGFVIMNNDSEANDAILGLNGFNFSGKMLSVSEAKPQEPRQNGPKRNFSNDSRGEGDRPNRPFVPRSGGQGDRPNNSSRPFTPRPGQGDRPNNTSRPFTPRTGSGDFQPAPPAFLGDSAKPKRDKDFKKDKPSGFDAEKKLKKEAKGGKKYNRFEDEDDEDLGYRIKY